MSGGGLNSARDYGADVGYNVALELQTKSLITVGPAFDASIRGEVFFLTDVITLGSGGDVEFVFNVPASDLVLMTASISSGGEATIELFEGPTGVSGGTTRTSFNFNRNIATAADMTVVENPTISGAGTKLSEAQIGQAGQGNASIGGETGGGLILKSSEAYLLAITSLAAGNNISYDFVWTEYTART